MRFIIAILLITSLASCAVEPEPLHYGKDACHACKMTLVDSRFGAEIVTQKGKIYKFDDVNCLTSFIKTSHIKEEDFKHILITDFSSPAKLIDAKNAFYLKSENIKSPMGSNTAAFGNEEVREQFHDQQKGSSLTWEDLTKEQHNHPH